MSVKNDNLSSRQAAAIRALLNNSTIASAAGEAGVNPRTIRRWLDKPHFVGALRAAESAAIGDTVRALIVDMRKNMDMIQGIRDDEGYPVSVRLRAAALIDSSLLKWREIQNVDERLSALELEIYGTSK